MQSDRHYSIFQHDVDPAKLSELRDALIDDICRLQTKNIDFGQFHASFLPPDEWSQMKGKYSRLLHHGCLNKRRLANELIWKWTEATGKYLGCPFWSIKAKQLFDSEASNSETPKRTIARLQSKKRPKEARLTHEHVYPIKDMTDWLQSRKELDRREIRTHFDRVCVGCVVLESEHDRTSGDPTNPWLRYRRVGIALAPNQAWPLVQRALIEAAGIQGQREERSAVLGNM